MKEGETTNNENIAYYLGSISREIRRPSSMADNCCFDCYRVVLHQINKDWEEDEQERT